jgi:hypothetical protein
MCATTAAKSPRSPAAHQSGYGWRLGGEHSFDYPTAVVTQTEQEAILPAGNGSHDEKRLRASDHLIGQRGIRGFVRQIFGASKESYVGPSLLGNVIADSALQHWIPGFESVQNRPLRGLTLDLECDVSVHARERS